MEHSRPTNDASMANNSTTFREKNDGQSILTRSPLSNRANIQQFGTTATNWDHKDSSEDQPSTHESICDAAWISTSDVATSPYQTPGRPATPPLPINIDIDIDIDSESPLSFLETSFLYGHGTELAPILEQRSIATLRTKGSQSTSDLSSLLHDAPGATTHTSETSRKHHSKSDSIIPCNLNSHPLRRQHSFTPIDNAVATTAYVSEDQDQDQESLSSSSSHAESSVSSLPSPTLKCLSYSRPTVHLVDVHTYPRKPLYAPPERAATPPSLHHVRRPRSSSSGSSGGDEGNAYMTDTSSLVGVAYEAPGFRGPRSGHGNLAAHPFMRGSAGAGAARHGRSERGQQQRLASTPAEVRLRREVGNAGGAAGAAAVGAKGVTHCRGNESETAHLRSDTAGSGLGVRGYSSNLYLNRSNRNRDCASRLELERRLERRPSRGDICKKCGHPRGENWSLFATLVGHGPGMRRGLDWCGRCAWRKVVSEWCCGE